MLNKLYTDSEYELSGRSRDAYLARIFGLGVPIRSTPISEMHTYKCKPMRCMPISEIHACEIHACEMHACEMYTYEMHVSIEPMD